MHGSVIPTIHEVIHRLVVIKLNKRSCQIEIAITSTFVECIILHCRVGEVASVQLYVYGWHSLNGGPLLRYFS